MGGLRGTMGRRRDIVRLAQWAGSAPKSDLGLDGSDRCRTSIVVVIMDIFPIFYILIFAIWKIPGNYRIRARGKSSRRGNRGNLPKSLASRNEPHSEFWWDPSQVLGVLGAKTGVLRGKIRFFISFWGGK